MSIANLIAETKRVPKTRRTAITTAEKYGPPPHTPNAETIESIKNIRAGKTRTIDSFEELLAELDA